MDGYILLENKGTMLFILLNDGYTPKNISIIFSPEFCSIDKY